MNIPIKDLQSDKIFLWGYIISSIFLFTGLMYILVSYTQLPPVIPLYNQMPWGDTRLGSKTSIFIPIVIAFSSYVGNIIILSSLYQKIPLVSRILSLTTLLMSLLAFLLIIRTIQLVR